MAHGAKHSQKPIDFPPQCCIQSTEGDIPPFWAFFLLDLDANLTKKKETSHLVLRGPKPVKHHSASVVHRHVRIGVTSSSLSTPRTLLSCCFWYNNSRRPGSCVTLWNHTKKPDCNWKKKELWSENHTAAPTTGCRPSTSTAAPRCYHPPPPPHPLTWQREEAANCKFSGAELKPAARSERGAVKDSMPPPLARSHDNDEAVFSAFRCHSI